MKKFKMLYGKYKVLTMTDQDYKKFEKDLAEAEKRAKERLFHSVENVINNYLEKIASGIKTLKDNEHDYIYDIELYSSHDDYPKSCSYTMYCTFVKLQLVGTRIKYIKCDRRCTSEDKCYTTDPTTIAYIIGKNLSSATYYRNKSKELTEAIATLSNVANTVFWIMG